MVLMFGILSLLSGCGKKKYEEIIPVSFPENASLIYFCINHQGMAMEPYYILKATDDGTYMKFMSLNPEEQQTDMAEEVWEDSVFIEKLEEAIVQCGALGWDGYDEKVSRKGVMDSGDSYELRIELSDGTTVNMRGYNTCPAGFESLLGQVRELFMKND